MPNRRSRASKNRFVQIATCTHHRPRWLVGRSEVDDLWICSITVYYWQQNAGADPKGSKQSALQQSGQQKSAGQKRCRWAKQKTALGSSSSSSRRSRRRGGSRSCVQSSCLRCTRGHVAGSRWQKKSSVVGSRRSVVGGQVAAVVVSGEDDFGGAVVAEFALLIVQVKASEVACIRLHSASGAS